MLKSLHTLVLPSWYPQFPHDLKGGFFRDQSLALLNEGCTIGVLDLNFSPNLKTAFSPKFNYENDEGLHTYRYSSLPLGYKIKFLKRFLFVSWGLKLFEAYIKTHGKPDIIQVHSYFPAGGLAVAIKNKYNIPFIVTEHSPLVFDKNLSKKRIIRLKKIANSANLNQSVSIAAALGLSELINKDCAVSHNSVHSSFLEEEFANLANAASFSFISICDFNKIKNLPLLIKAFALAFPKDHDVILKIGGNGDLFHEMTSLVRQMNLEKRVLFLDYLSRENVKNTVNNSHIYVISSDHETFGVAVIEALALGKPVIATACGGPQNYINEQNGLLVDVNNVEQLAQAMINMRLKYSFYNQENIRINCKEQFSSRVIAKNQITVFNSHL